MEPVLVGIENPCPGQRRDVGMHAAVVAPERRRHDVRGAAAQGALAS